MNKEQFVKHYAVKRKGTVSLKWDLLEQRFGDPDLIPMWVADMDFRTPECITDALHRRVAHGAYGYAYIPESYYEACFNWMESRYGFRPQKEMLRLTNGIVAAMYYFVNAYTEPGDSIIINTPVYYPFAGAIRDCGRKVVSCDMDYQHGHFSIALDKFEKDIVKNDVKMYFLCSPHNPCGRVWTEEELDQVLSICQKHHVIVFSDEIHQDFVFGDHKQICAAAVSGGKYADNLVIASAGSKTFNIAALVHANIIIPGEALRAKYDAYAAQNVQADWNIMGITATEAGYTNGSAYLSSLKDVIYSNYAYIKKGLEEKAPKIVVCDLEGTYLPMLDLRNVIDVEHPVKEPVILNGKAPVNYDVYEFVQLKCRLAVDYGEWFGEKYSGFFRLNLATTPETIKVVVNNIMKAYNEVMNR